VIGSGIHIPHHTPSLPPAHQRTNETYKGVVWPGPTVFPDFTSQAARDWWTSEFARFFDPETGVDVSGIWLDMNEPASFQPYLEANVDRISSERMVPPDRPEPRVLSRTVTGFEAFRAGRNVSTPFVMGNDTVPEQSRAMVDQVRQRLTTRQNVQGNDSLADTEDPSLDSQWLYPP
jgi:alpha-glucosidase (family GH31 glycosyl hydrolase)